MSNTYFAFKQFTVQQDACAMKVSTDSCIQGAWTPACSTAKGALDIGAGTGLLSLMLAQRFQDLRIDALELDIPAATQAAENVAASPFAERISVVQADAGSWVSPVHYDLIICNPPFFTNSLTGPDIARNAARHITALDPRTLAEIIGRNLSPKGIASIMWPPAEQNTFAANAAASGLYLQKMLQVRDKASTRLSRTIAIYGRQECAQPLIEELIICNPPFFTNSLTGPDIARNAARHITALDPRTLAEIIGRELSPKGIASIMWPPAEQNTFAANAAASGLYLQKMLQVRDKAGSRLSRTIAIYGRQECAQPLVEELIIKTGDGSYTPAFVDLLAPFYLRL